MRVLVACEFSGVVRDAFKDKCVKSVLIPGFPAYRIYPDGTVESRWQQRAFYDGFKVEDKWTKPKLRKHEGGYFYIELRDGYGGKRRVAVHTLVAEIFIGPKPFPKAVVRHLDGCPSHNDVRNLAWGTYKENEADKKLHGTWDKRNGGARLTPQQINEIRRRCSNGERHEEIAKDFGVSRPTITRAASYTTWKIQCAC